MDPKAWCGPASVEDTSVLEGVHRDYLAAGADIITANTYASSRLMLTQAGVGERFDEINRTAVRAALRARDASPQACLVAGSLSHMCPVRSGSAEIDRNRFPPRDEMAAAFAELATLLKEEGCDLILLEMMYDPVRMALAFEAAAATGLPVWAGFSVRRGATGEVLSFAHDEDLPFADILEVLQDFPVDAAGVMHSPSNVIADAISILRQAYAGPLMAYPDSGYFSMPHWQFENIIPPETFRGYAEQWVEDGVQILGGCCGLSPEHIAAVNALKSSGSSHRGA